MKNLKNNFMFNNLHNRLSFRNDDKILKKRTVNSFSGILRSLQLSLFLDSKTQTDEKDQLEDNSILQASKEKPGNGVVENQWELDSFNFNPDWIQNQSLLYETLYDSMLETLINDLPQNYEWLRSKNLNSQSTNFLIIRIYIQYLSKIINMDFSNLVNYLVENPPKMRDLYESYLKYYNSLDTQIILLLAKKKEYADEKSFYKVFLNYFGKFYSWDQIRRNDGLYLKNLKKKLPQDSQQKNKDLLQGLLEEKNNNGLNQQSETFFKTIIRFFTGRSKQQEQKEPGVEIMTFLVMQIFIQCYLQNNHLIDEQGQIMKAYDFWQMYQEFLKDFDVQLINVKKNMQTPYNKNSFQKDFTTIAISEKPLIYNGRPIAFG